MTLDSGRGPPADAFLAPRRTLWSRLEADGDDAMSIWGKLLGGAAGFTLGGPIGALIGAVAGHAVDRMREGTGAGAEDGTKQIAFTIGVIVLGAKMAKADGVVTKDEIVAFREVFHVPEHESRNVSRIFNMARRDAQGFEPYARQIAGLFTANREVLEDLLAGLMHIAKADNVIHPGELEYLRQVAAIFGFDEAEFARIRATYLGPDPDDHYTILGVSPEIDDAGLKRAYRSLIKENHPDRLTAQGLPEEFIELANQKLARINAAYEAVAKQRGIG